MDLSKVPSRAGVACANDRCACVTAIKSDASERGFIDLVLAAMLTQQVNVPRPSRSPV